MVWGCFLSAGLHGLVGVHLRAEATHLSADSHSSALPGAAAGSVELRGLHPERLEPPTPGGIQPESALDTRADAGRSRPGRKDDRSIVLFSFVSEITLQDSDLNNVHDSQTQRIQTARERLTQEVRRATPNPRSAPLLASGSGGPAERRPRHRRRAALGSVTGVTLPRTTARPQPPTSGSMERVTDLQQTQRAALAAPPERLRGVTRGTGAQQRLASATAFERPAIDRGPAATPADPNRVKVSDNRESELLAAKLVRSMIDASQQGRRSPQPRQSGLYGRDEPGLDAHARGDGARALRVAPGAGRHFMLDAHFHRYQHWFSVQKERVQRGLIFPRSRALAMDQGTSLVRVTVARSGRFVGSPRIVRSSGFSDFDAAALAALDGAAPFHPLPPEIAPDARELSLLIPIVFSNPMVH